MSRMRLICPNCGAQYEVPVDVIPEGGRDVQCSSCGHTWYQRHPDDDPDLAEELNEPLPDRDWTPEDDAAHAAQPDHTPEPAPAAVDPAEQADLTLRRQIDPQMAALFAEERDLEVRRRQAETLETQPELGLAEPDEDEQARRAREARERMARLRGEDPEGDAPRPATPRPTEVEPPEDPGRAAAEAAAAAAAAGSRRDLLPDVDEINQTLRGSELRPDPTAEDRLAAARERPGKTESGGGFARGFFMVVVLAALCMAIYAYAPQIKGTVPQVSPLLDAYVAQVDAGRIWLDAQIGALLQSLDGMSSEARSAD